MINYPNLNKKQINSNSLYNQWITDEYKTISRQELINFVGGNNNVTCLSDYALTPDG